jgi:3-deoxy-D-manno-octulosonate 8-phosphate phosphatase (KDO 8-P phosphatase)
MEQIYDRARNVKLLLMDVDGVLTDGLIYFIPGPNGEWTETKAFDTQDGLALQWLHWKGIKTGVISGRDSPTVELRAKTGHMAYCYQGHLGKIPIIEEILADSKLSPDEIAYVGDDLTDVVVFRRVGWAIAVANARSEVKQSAHYVTETPGGRGAIREVAEILLKTQGMWDEILEKYEIGRDE